MRILPSISAARRVTKSRAFLSCSRNISGQCCASSDITHSTHRFIIVYNIESNAIIPNWHAGRFCGRVRCGNWVAAAGKLSNAGFANPTFTDVKSVEFRKFPARRNAHISSRDAIRQSCRTRTDETRASSQLARSPFVEAHFSPSQSSRCPPSLSPPCA